MRPLLGHRNVRLRLFGSRARGDAGSRSDIDLALVSPVRLPPDLLALAREAIEEAPIPFRANIVDYHSADDQLRHEIDRDGIGDGPLIDPCQSSTFVSFDTITQ